MIKSSLGKKIIKIHFLKIDGNSYQRNQQVVFMFELAMCLQLKLINPAMSINGPTV